MLLFFPIIRRLCFFGDVLLSEMGDSEKNGPSKGRKSEEIASVSSNTQSHDGWMSGSR